MQDILLERYEAVTYSSGAIPDSHPARLGAIARLHGIRAADPDHCRVLELGCADGMNLLPLAERFPRSQFLGVDFGSAHITAAEEACVACNLDNIRFVRADLREFEPEPAAYDYVIAHGVYSWVGDEVKDRVLAICARALAPGGVAYVSYNTFPVWGLLGGLREFLFTETARQSEPREQIAHAQRVIGALNESMSGQPGAYAELLRQSLSDMLQKQPDHLYHDDISAVNDPCTFAKFTSHASAHGLHYLAEAHYATMMFEHVPAPMRAALAGLDLDFFRAQQFMDVMFQRWLRNSLLCGSTVRPERTVDPRIIQDCALCLRMRLAGDPLDLRPGIALRFTGPNDLSLEFTHPAEKALLTALTLYAPARLPFPLAVEAGDRLLQQAGLPSMEVSEELCGMLYRLFALDALDLVLIGDGEWLRTGKSPAPSALMRYQARIGASVVNRWHEPVTVTEGGRQFIADPSHHPADAALRAGLLV